MIGIIFFVVGLILYIVGVRLNLSNLASQTASGKSGSQVSISATSTGKILQYVAMGCWLIAILYGFGILGGSSEPSGQVAGRRRRR
jgi:hypothetical protein